MGLGLPSKQTVNGVGGRLQARNVRVGSRLWTLDGERTVQTTVTQVVAVKVRQVVDVVTDHVSFTVAPDQLLGTTFEGFLDGCTDGDGFRPKTCAARVLVSSNAPFRSQLVREVGARFTPRGNGLASHLVVADSWPSRGTFKPEQHPLGLIESTWVEVRDVRPREAGSPKRFTLYSYRLDPYPGFLVNGHLARQPW